MITQLKPGGPIRNVITRLRSKSGDIKLSAYSAPGFSSTDTAASSPFPKTLYPTTRVVATDLVTHRAGHFPIAPRLSGIPTVENRKGDV
jgi:hypothetical protein